MAIDLHKQQALDNDPKVIQEIDFAGNLSRKYNHGRNINDNKTMFIIIEEVKEHF